MSTTEADDYRIEAAWQFGAKSDDDCTHLTFTEPQLLAFAKACERKGRAEAAREARRRLEYWPTFGLATLGSLADEMDRRNVATDADLVPILEVERVKQLAEAVARK